MRDYDLTPDGVPVVDWSSCDVPCAELDALGEELALRGVSFIVMSPSFTIGWQVIYQGEDGWPVSVIYNPMSNGHKAGLLEAARMPVRDVMGWLNAVKVLREFPPMVTP